VLLCPPGLDFITAFFGCLSVGMVATRPVPHPRRLDRDWPRLKSILRQRAQQ
jgi:acyl-CoA synthetase (AMP-forming)/AMP-acid ligase II